MVYYGKPIGYNNHSMNLNLWGYTEFKNPQVEFSLLKKKKSLFLLLLFVDMILIGWRTNKTIYHYCTSIIRTLHEV